MPSVEGVKLGPSYRARAHTQSAEKDGQMVKINFVPVASIKSSIQKASPVLELLRMPAELKSGPIRHVAP